jgi:hypothetical protein
MLQEARPVINTMTSYIHESMRTNYSPASPAVRRWNLSAVAFRVCMLRNCTKRMLRRVKFCAYNYTQLPNASGVL